jgi:ubiquinone/menaquinone biosynthesis C-methylase UbiE
MSVPPLRRASDTDPIARFYAQTASAEWERLEGQSMEMAVTLRALTDHLPAAPASVLDCGGGPGRYAIELAGRGYQVTLFDLSSECLDLARAKANEAAVELDGVVQGSATDLSAYESGSFDAVLLLGPLYHLIEDADRQRALAEARRVLKPDGVIFAAFISRYAIVRYKAVRDPMWIMETERVEQLLDTGVVGPREPDGVEFVAHYIHPPEVAPLLSGAGFEMITLLGAEGVVHMIEDRLAELPSEPWEAWVDLNYRLAGDPSILSCSGHLLAVARKNAEG